MVITSKSNPLIKDIIKLSGDRKYRRAAGLFVVEGLKPVTECINSDCIIERIVCREDMLDNFPQAVAVSEGVFDAISTEKAPQGVLALVHMPQNKADKPQGSCLLLDRIQDPGNLGTMLRTGEGAGADAVIMSRKTVDIYNPKTIRSTMGALYREPFVYVEGLGQAIALLRQYQIPVYAAHLKGRQYFDELSYEKGGAFLIGNEGNGLCRETAEQADIWVKIPMEGKAESLNAAVAAALLMYQASGYFRRSKRSKAT